MEKNSFYDSTEKLSLAQAELLKGAALALAANEVLKAKQKYMSAALNGNPMACENLAQILLKEGDFLPAVKWLLEGLDLRLYKKINETEERSPAFMKKIAGLFAPALRYIKKESAAGRTEAACLFARLICHGFFDKSYVPAAMKYLMAAAEKEYVPAYSAMGRLYMLECSDIYFAERKPEESLKGDEAIRWFSLAVACGDKKAALQLALAYKFKYDNGRYSSPQGMVCYPFLADCESVFMQILKEQSDNGNAEAMFLLAMESDEAEYKKKLLQAAASLNFLPAVNAYALELQDRHCSDDKILAKKLLQLSASQGDIFAMTYLGIYGSEIGLDEDLSLSFLERAALAGNALAAFGAADEHSKLGNAVLAEDYYLRAAEGGYVPAYYALATMKMHSDKPKEKKECLNLLRKGAMLGDAQCMSLCGILLADEGKTKDKEEALKWLKLAAAKKDGLAEYYLSSLYAGDYIGKPRPALAYKYACLSAKNNYVCGYYQLGFFYEQGIGIKKDYKLAMENYKKALSLGHPDAPYKIGRMYEEGIGVESDFKKARRYYELGAERNEPQCLKAIARLDFLENGQK